jgi:putative ABC transport system permease protein
MDNLLRDIRYAIRMCVRTPGFTAVAVLALALGIGANTAIFTIVNAALIERLPFKDPSRLVIVWEESSRRPGRSNTVGPANYLRWRERATSFEELAGFVNTRVNLTGTGDPEELTLQRGTAGFFRILGVPPLVGRPFSAAEEQDPRASVTILSYPLWQRRFGGDPSVVGRAVQLNGLPRTVVGVMPPDFHLTVSAALVRKPADAWLPWVLPAEARDPGGRFMSVVGRLKPGVPVSQAQAEMATIASGLAAEFPEFDTGWSVKVVPLRDELAGAVRPALLMLAGAVAFVLLIACANVANLLLARGAVRQREIAIRTALGAGRGRVMRQLLTESIVLALVGGSLGLLVAEWGLDLMVAVSPVDLTQIGHIRLSYAVLAFTATTSVVTALVAGFAPAFESARADMQAALKEGARQAGPGARHRQLRESLVVAEVALAVVLLVGAGLMIRSFASLQAVNPGFDARNVLTMRISLPDRRYDTPKTLRFFDEAVRRARAIPGVQAAGAISYLPFAGLGAGTKFAIVGEPPPPPGQDHVTDVSVCDNGYFEAMRIPLVEGRWFAEREMHEQSNVVIVSRALVDKYFPNGGAIGKKLVINMTDEDVPTEIIGIVGNAKFTDLRAEMQPQTYWPHPQLPYNAMTLVVRTASDPSSFATALAAEIHEIDKDQPVSEVRTMDQWIARSLSQARFTSLLLAIFAALALVLASIGIYGVISYAVSQRTSEIGVRLALGAERRDILRMIVSSAMRLAAAGLAIGIVLAVALSRAVTALLYETTGADPLTLAAVVFVLGTVALLASYLPARRAARIAPVEALRYQ